MNQEVKQLWVEALRSGKYEQGKYCLRTAEGKYCCLGVLCEISGKEYNPEQLGIPNEIMEWADLDSYLPEIPDSQEVVGGPVKLSHLNDAANYSFEQIATLIEEQL